jgi:predicted amidohydrolase
MRVTVLELPARWGNPAAALGDVDAILARGPETDLVVLPEASLTGYVSPRGDFDLGPFAERIDGETARASAALAKKHRVHLLAPLILWEDDRFSNAAALFDPAGERIGVYRKRHPWFPETWATAGTEPPPVIGIGETRITIAICFDVHFLAEDARSELEQADLLLFPSAWVDDADTLQTLLQDLARGFDVAIASANWGPGVVTLRGQGGSCIVDRTGKILARAGKTGPRADATV